jgi:hypothetical protein
MKKNYKVLYACDSASLAVCKIKYCPCACEQLCGVRTRMIFSVTGLIHCESGLLGQLALIKSARLSTTGLLSSISTCCTVLVFLNQVKDPVVGMHWQVYSAWGFRRVTP